MNPDEQRRYLGTFRERVCLTISNAQIKERSWTTAVETELKKGWSPRSSSTVTSPIN
ncbi:DUF1694 domain-containing protein [Limosilactobacillus fermentum]|nr:DUF1694 domain-containing protein [Limosilactobacillus fermentum]